MKHTILYIPGLGDGYDSFRRNALKFWAVFGVRAILVPMRWDDQESYDSKYQRVIDAVENASANNDKVTIIGESAGGSMAINAYAASPMVDKLITIAGVNTSSTPVAPYRLRRSPAFAVSRQNVAKSLATISSSRMANVHTVSALADSVVRSHYSQIAGAVNHRVIAIGHFYTITLCLTLFSSYIIRLAKRV